MATGIHEGLEDLYDKKKNIELLKLFSVIISLLR